ncbi:KR domain-containing protein, partial [Nocardia sp. NPDC058497]|uniref:KR domain-containing protein n=1 Tax=Nocardia sp. NPDC058497 TaxID=3346529 RepID=UPI00364E0DE7
NAHTYSITSRAATTEHAATPRVHASAHRTQRRFVGVASSFDWEAARVRCAEVIDPTELARNLDKRGIVSSAFAWRIDELRLGPAEVLAEISIDNPTSWAALLDAAFTVPMLVSGTADRSMKMISGVQQVELEGRWTDRIRIHASARAGMSDVIDISIADTTGQPIAHLGGAEFVEAPAFRADGIDNPLMHTVTWKRWELDTDQRAAVEDSVAIVGSGALAAYLRDGLREAGAEVVCLAHAADLSAEVGAAIVLHVQDTALHTGDRVDTRLAELTGELRALTRAAAQIPGRRVWLLTDGVRDARAAHSPLGSALWGAAQSMRGEADKVWGGIVDLPTTPHTGVATVLRQLLARPGTGEIVAIDADAAVWRYRVERAESSLGTGDFVCATDAAYVVSGGESSFGLRSAQWLAHAGARTIIMLSATDVDAVTERDEVAETLAALRAAEVTVLWAQVDYQVPDAVRAGIDTLRAELPVRGVIHAVNPLESERFGPFDAAAHTEILCAAVGSATTLHELFPPASVDFLVLHSSALHLLGVGGRTATATAGAYCDALARLRAEGSDSLSLALGWTPWRGLLDDATGGAFEYELRGRALGLLDDDQVDGVWTAAVSTPDTTGFAILNHTDAGARRVAVPALETVEAVQDQLADAAAAPGESVLDEVTKLVAKETRLPVEEVVPTLCLSEIGSDSVLILAVRRALERRFAVRIPTRLMWEAGTVDAIAAHIAASRTS